jgi:opacity protein-like surface antigen
MTNRIHPIVVAALLAAVLAPAAAAPVAAQPIQVIGGVPVRCKISPPAAGASDNASFAPGSNGGELQLTRFVDPGTALTHASEGTILFSITCTGAYALTVTSQGGLSNQNAGSPSGGFATHVNYTLSAIWAGATKSVETSGSAVTLDLSQSGDQSGDLSIGISLPAGKGPLTAGTYTDEIVIQLNAQ